MFVLDNSFSMFNEKDVEVSVMLPGGQPAESAPAPAAAASSPAAVASGTTLYYWEGFSGRAEVGFSPSFSAIFNRKTQKLPLFSCILLRNEGGNRAGGHPAA